MKTFDALDRLAQLVTHIPNKGEQMVRYYEFYSNKSRGLRKKAVIDDEVPALIDSDISQASEFVRCQATTASANEWPPTEALALSSMISPHRPARMIT